MNFTRRPFMSTTAAAGALAGYAPSILRAQDTPPPVFGGTITASMDLGGKPSLKVKRGWSF